ncbi:hypothetical protein niasHT_022106 [Heterodera trifolii]|uniref:beta-fructofuranosidase n=1 Tax=Heterodera trifolii TaxID=157864 RepID=A0ABD2KNM6_9BILA
MAKKHTIVLTVIGVCIVVAVIAWGIIRSQLGGSNTSGIVTVPVQLYSSSILHIWLKTRSAAQEMPARIRLRHPAMDNITLAKTDQFIEYEFHELALLLEGPANLEWAKEDTRVSYIYVFEPDTVLERGIRPAFIANAARFPDVREGYHFRPPLGWMNDPNGFSKFGDHFHLFYQHYPHALHWNAMYWGHAVSRDLINWVHQPIFLLPDPAVALEHDGIGGIYSGSAVVVIDAVSGRPKMNVYYTDSLNDRVPWQFQRAVTTMNGIMPDRAATTLIPDVPPGVGLMPDFRDPSVFMGPDGRWKMVLSSKDNQGGVVLLYETADKQAMANWRFLNVLHRDSRVNTSVVECAALLPLPAPVGSRTSSTVPLWVLLYGQLDAFDPRTGRRNMSPAFVGTFDGRQFRALFEQELDFATGSYAFQGFYEQSLDQTLMIGWLANWRDYDAETKSDFPTSMTVPRQMLLSRDGTALLTPPIDLRSLRMRRLDDGHLLQSGQTVQLPTGTAEIRLIIRQEVLQLHDDTVQLEVDHPKTETAPGVLIAPEGLEILPGKSHSTPQRLIALGARPTEVHILLDTGSIEVFADGGRWTGTHRFEGFDRFSAIRLRGELSAVVRSEVWALKGAEFRGRLGPQQF